MANFDAQDLVAEVPEAAGIPDLPAAELVPSVAGGVTTFVMRAFHNVPTLGHVYWDSLNEPDATGDLSGFPLIELDDIVVIQVYVA